jgi:hypothetical protein
MRTRPDPIDVSRSRSKSPSRMFRSIQRKFETKQLTAPIRSETKKAHSKIKVLSISGEMVEPHTPPGVPPYIRSTIRRPIIKNVLNNPI